MSRGPLIGPAAGTLAAEAIELYIGRGGRVVWNGTTVPAEQLDAYMAAAALD